MSSRNETPRYDTPEFTPEDIERYIARGRRLRARMAGDITRSSISGLARIFSYPLRAFRPRHRGIDTVALTRHELRSQHSA